YHRCHYNSSGRLFDVRLGTDGSAVCDGPNPAQWTGVTLSNGNRLEFRSREMQRVIDALIMRMILGGDILFRGDRNWQGSDGAPGARPQREIRAIGQSRLPGDDGVLDRKRAVRTREGGLYRRRQSTRRSDRRSSGRDSVLRRVWGIAAEGSGEAAVSFAGPLYKTRRIDQADRSLCAGGRGDQPRPGRDGGLRAVPRRPYIPLRRADRDSALAPAP